MVVRFSDDVFEEAGIRSRGFGCRPVERSLQRCRLQVSTLGYSPLR